MQDVRSRIISSVFSRRNASGALEETYVAHTKIWEDAGPEGGDKKPRYILLSRAINGNGFLHKSKLNSNGTFSVGKTWRVQELRALQVINTSVFNITLSRTYRWQTENEAEQTVFLNALVRLFREISDTAPLQLEGLSEPPGKPTTAGSSNRVIPSSLEARRISSQVQYDDTYRTPTSAAPVQSSLPSRSVSPARSQISSAAAGRPREQVPTSTRTESPTSRTQQRLPSNTHQIPTTLTSSRLSLNNRSTEPLPSFADTADNPYLTNQPRTRPASPSVPNVPQRPIKSSNRELASDVAGQRRDNRARISFYDNTNQAAFDRLVSGQSDTEGEDENAQATMANVEEMLEGYEWASEDILGRKNLTGTADLIEARLMDELMALEKANIHSFLESDDRVGVVLKYMDDAIAELDNMESLVSSYKIHLNAVGDDISFIQSQNRGLQVQTQNQRALLSELENLLRTVHIDQDALVTLTQESLEKATSIQRLEEAAAQLYKALQAGRDTDMAATMERLQEYRTHNSQFCKRMFDFLSIMFTAQAKMLLGDSNGLVKVGKSRPTVAGHQDMEVYLGRYAGLMLYLKEMEETVYGKLCAAYFSAASELHNTQLKALLASYTSSLKKATEEEQEQSFALPTTTAISKGTTGMRRAGTLIRSPMEGRYKDRDRAAVGDLRVSEGLGLVLEQIVPLIYSEDAFITDFLQINDAALTFADYMGLDNYFRRQAARGAGLSQTTSKLIRGAMDLIFGFLPSALKTWLDDALAKDNMEVVGVMAVLERFLADAEERGNQFLLGLLGKQHTRLKGIFDRHVSQQIKGIEQTKLSSKKRKGVAHFVKYFPIYIGRVESQLIGADGLEIRASVDTAYDSIVTTMFESLKQMAKMDGEGEDKGQLNYHVILIENMHHFVAETSQLDVGAVSTFSRRAEAIYDENVAAYVKIVLRRPFSKILDFFEGIEKLLKTTGPREVSNNSNFNKAALKKVIKEYTGKDIKKHVDALFKRVEKHFTEASEKTTEEGAGIAPGTVMVGVWKACEEELLKMTDTFAKRIAQCYADSGISLEYSATDIEAAFKRQRVGF